MAYLSINSLMSGLAGGIIGAVFIFLTTIMGVFRYSKAAKLLGSTVWKKWGYRVTFLGAFWGAVLGFIYGFLIWFVFSTIYNSLI